MALVNIFLSKHFKDQITAKTVRKDFSDALVCTKGAKINTADMELTIHH